MNIPREPNAPVIKRRTIRRWHEETPGTVIDDGFDLVLQGGRHNVVPRIQRGITHFTLEVRTYATKPPQKHHFLISDQDSRWGTPHVERLIGCSPKEVEKRVNAELAHFRQDPYRLHQQADSPALMGLYLG